MMDKTGMDVCFQMDDRDGFRGLIIGGFSVYAPKNQAGFGKVFPVCREWEYIGIRHGRRGDV